MSTSVEIILKELGVSSVDDLTEEFCKNINYLNLSFKGLKDLNGCENIFSHLKNLEILYLKYNYLANIDKDTFKHNKNLKKLDLYSNSLVIIDKDTFKHNINLEILYLQHNVLANYDKDVFKYNINLKKLFLSNNNLKTLKGIPPHSIPVLCYGNNPLTEYPRNLEELKEYNRTLALTKIRNVFLKIYVQRIVDNYWYAPSKEILENGEVVKVSRYCIWCKMN